MAEPEDSKRWLAQQQLEALKFSYKDHEDWWRALDTKAQGTVAISGIFLAGGFAFVDQLGHGTPRIILAMLVVAVASLIASIGLSVFALIIVPTATLPTAKASMKECREVLAVMTPDEAHARGTNYLLDQSELWIECIDETAAVGDRKAERIQVAQWLVLAAAVAIALAALLRIFSNWT
jgi:hypothetical protein